jgi:hypothetical protein
MGIIARPLSTPSTQGPARRGWLPRLAGAIRLRPDKSGLGDSRGSILLETVIASMVLAMAGTAVLAGLSVMHRTGALVEGQSLVENVARNQMEHVFTLPYLDVPVPYATIVAPAGYSVTAVPADLVAGVSNANVQKVVVTATHSGASTLTLETVRARP